MAEEMKPTGRDRMFSDIQNGLDVGGQKRVMCHRDGTKRRVGCRNVLGFVVRNMPEQRTERFRYY